MTSIGEAARARRTSRADRVVSVKQVSLPGVDAEIIDCRWPEPFSVTTRDPRHTVSLSLTPPPRSSRGRFTHLPGEVPLGDLVFVPAGVELNAACDGGPQRLVRCCFSEERFEQLTGLRAERMRQERTTPALNADQVHFALSLLAEEIARPGVASAGRVAILVKWLASDLPGVLGAACWSDEGGALRKPQLRQIEERIADLERPLPTVNELAADLRISSRHLMRAYKAAAGTTLGSRLRRAGQDRAVELLTHSRLPLKVVAHQLGFSSPSSFSTAFKNNFGLTPRAFRQRAWG